MCFRCSFFHVPNFRFKGPRDKVDKHKAQRYNAANVVMIVGDPRIGVENFQSFSDSGPSVFFRVLSTFLYFLPSICLIASIGSLLDQVGSTYLLVSCCHLSKEGPSCTTCVSAKCGKETSIRLHVARCWCWMCQGKLLSLKALPMRFPRV